MRVNILPFLLTLAASCNTPSSANQEGQGGAAGMAPPVSAGLTATKVDDVWIFIGSAPPDAELGKMKVITTDALHGGRPTIENNCLLVDGEVIVWWSDQLELAERLVGEAKVGSPTDVSIPGGPSADAPSIVSDRCGVTKLRYAGKSN